MRQGVAGRIGAWARRQVARTLVERDLDLHVSGLDRLPADVPLILFARHYHHLYDAAAILASVPSEVHVVIALDWLGGGWPLRVMQLLASAARWPGVWRRGDAWRFNRAGYRLARQLLDERKTVLIFPEGYPTVDPRGRTKMSAFLPFDAGGLVLAERAAAVMQPVAVVPVGLSYTARDTPAWEVWLRFGSPTWVTGRDVTDRGERLRALEADVRRLSEPPPVERGSE